MGEEAVMAPGSVSRGAGRAAQFPLQTFFVSAAVLRTSARFPRPLRSLAAMAGGPYSGTSTLALVARISAVSIGVAYGSMKLAYLKARAPAPVKH